MLAHKHVRICVEWIDEMEFMRLARLRGWQEDGSRGDLLDLDQDVWSEVLAASPSFEDDKVAPTSDAALAVAKGKREVYPHLLDAHPSLREGDWVATRVGPEQFSSQIQIAKVKDVYRDPVEPRGDCWLLDLVFYGRDGAKLGRVSPAMGGPRGFEPACTASKCWR
jgi:hypothetical protein